MSDPPHVCRNWGDVFWIETSHGYLPIGASSPLIMRGLDSWKEWESVRERSKQTMRERRAIPRQISCKVTTSKRNRILPNVPTLQVVGAFSYLSLFEGGKAEIWIVDSRWIFSYNSEPFLIRQPSIMRDYLVIVVYVWNSVCGGTRKLEWLAQWCCCCWWQKFVRCMGWQSYRCDSTNIAHIAIYFDEFGEPRTQNFDMHQNWSVCGRRCAMSLCDIMQTCRYIKRRCSYQCL